MKNKLIYIILMIFALAIDANAQLAALSPVAMEVLDTPDNGDKIFAHVEVWFNGTMPGAKITTDNYIKRDIKYGDTETSLHAKAIADVPSVKGAFCKSVTITHPDYLPCVMSFENLGLKESLKPGHHYRIKVDVPAAELVKAHKAFSDLDYETAKNHYNKYAENGNAEDVAVARQRIELMTKLAPQLKYLKDNANSTDKNIRTRMMKCASDIYSLTNSKTAYRQYMALKRELVRKSVIADSPDGSSVAIVDGFGRDERDARAKSDTSLPLSADGKPIYSWIIVNAGVADGEFDVEGQFKNPEYVDGHYRLYVASGDAGPKELTMHHPDLEPINVKFSDYSVDAISPGAVYVLNVKTPPAAVIEADRAFASLDFPSAQILYGEILENDEKYDENIISAVNEKMFHVNSLITSDFRSKWKGLVDFFVKRPTASREELAGKADSLVYMSKILDNLGVPGMERNTRHYEDRAYEYRNSIYLTFSMGEMTKYKEIVLDGNAPKAFGAKTLRLEYKVPGRGYTFGHNVQAHGKGLFSTYLPREVSSYLSSHPGSEVEVMIMNPATRKTYKIRAGGNDSFKIALDKKTDRSLSANLYVQPEA